MRTYEALFIVKPDQNDDEVQTIAKEVESLVTEAGGAIVRSEIWGKRRLAYEVSGSNEGIYVLLRFDSEPTFIDKLESHFRLSEAIVRHLVMYLDKKTLRLEAEQAKRTEELLAARVAGPGHHDDDDDPPMPRRSTPKAEAPAAPSTEEPDADTGEVPELVVKT
ncbi:MAG: 30S ribosomal protein S6 [Candidatus Hydrogenedentes bacterium]|nr:30S ribosomal protein S6 [Candidatus Hydrogenedentota bacterium]